jgi:hypothetical protein
MRQVILLAPYTQGNQSIDKSFPFPLISKFMLELKLELDHRL